VVVVVEEEVEEEEVLLLLPAFDATYTPLYLYGTIKRDIENKRKKQRMFV